LIETLPLELTEESKVKFKAVAEPAVAEPGATDTVSGDDDAAEAESGMIEIKRTTRSTREKAENEFLRAARYHRSCPEFFDLNMPALP